ncbi:MAG: DNA polymerase I [Anaerolineae bacterium]
MPRNRLMLIDGHSLAYRAFHALPADLTSPSGEPTNATYGFILMLLSVLEEEAPEYAIVAFDKGPSFRVREYEAYKAHREKMPDEMRVQMDRIREIVDAFGIPIVELEDYEADDLLGTLSREAEARGFDVLIVTGDRDAVQLVDDHVMVLTSGRRFSDTIRYTPERVREQYGLEPEQLIDLKALIGDRSDNIPGVKGVGEKGATQMLQEYGTLEGVYEHIDELSTRYRNALSEQREEAFLSRKLGRIGRDVPVELDVESAQVGEGFDRERVLRLMQQLGFRSLVERIPVAAETEEAADGEQLLLFNEEEIATQSERSLGDYYLVHDVEELHELCSRLTKAPALAVDTETTDIDAVIADLVGISVTDREGEAWYIPVRAPRGDLTIPLTSVVEHFGPILADETCVKVGHNLKYDMKVLAQAGLPVAGPLFDTMVGEWVLNPDSALGLKSQAWTRLGIQMTEITELIGSGRNQTTMDHVPLSAVTPYTCADADITLRLAHLIEPELKAREQDKLFRELEMPLLPVLVDMELTGIKLDAAWLQQLSQELSVRLETLEQSIFQHAGQAFNVNSTQQLSEVLFDRLGLSTRGTSKTKSGYYSTRASVLEGLKGEHPIVDDILEYRELSKLQSTYVDSLPALVNPETGRVHTSYNPTGTVTGRISSNNPNLQNIPIRTEEGRRIRRAFVAEEGWLLLGADYSQVELRVMAHVSKDSGLVSAFERGEDIHATTAAAIYGVPLDAVSYQMRSVAKAVNFGLIYGQSAFGLARQLGIAVDDAQAFIDRYFERFPGVRAYMEDIQRDAAERGYVETLLNRRRYFPELMNGSRASTRQRQAAVRMAINTPIQGSAADIIKLAMIRMHEVLKERALRARMLLQVHDEVVLEVPEDELDAVAEIVRDTMENAIDLDVPLKVDVETGPNWLDMS